MTYDSAPVQKEIMGFDSAFLQSERQLDQLRERFPELGSAPKSLTAFIDLPEARVDELSKLSPVLRRIAAVLPDGSNIVKQLGSKSIQEQAALLKNSLGAMLEEPKIAKLFQLLRL
jgi:hypothetical protein